MDPNGGIGPIGPRLDTNNTMGQMPNDVSGGMPLQNTGAPLTAPEMSAVDQLGAVPQPPSQPQFMQSETPMAPPVQPPPPENIETDLLVPPPSGPDNKKVIIIAILSVVVCIALGTAMFFVGFASGKTKGRAEADKAWQIKEAERQKAEDEKNGDDSADTAEELELGDLVEPTYSADESLEGETGEQITSADGFVIKVTNTERNFKPEDPNYKADPTKELVKINFVIGNLMKNKTVDVNVDTIFRLEDSSGAKLIRQNLADYPGKLDEVKLEPGAQSKGSIVYQVNKDEAPLKFVRTQKYSIRNQNREVLFVVSITVAK